MTEKKVIRITVGQLRQHIREATRQVESSLFQSLKPLTAKDLPRLPKPVTAKDVMKPIDDMIKSVTKVAKLPRLTTSTKRKKKRPQKP